ASRAHQRAYPLGRRRVPRHGGAPHPLRHGRCGVAVEVGDDHSGTLGGEPCGQRRSDALTSAGDDDPGSRKIDRLGCHSPPPSVTPPSTTSVCPVIHAAPSDNRNVTAPATSEGTPSRFIG